MTRPQAQHAASQGRRQKNQAEQLLHSHSASHSEDRIRGREGGEATLAAPSSVSSKTARLLMKAFSASCSAVLGWPLSALNM